MILNGLGFINTALYMTPRFFHDKPISLLLGDGVTAKQLNDDCLGRCLDKIAAYGTTRWYSEIALKIIQNAGLLSRTAHIDSTTLSLYGNYESSNKAISPKPLLGYSKDHRPDLKQVTLQCVSLGKNVLPIWMEALDGNSSDKKSFSETVKRVDEFYKAAQSAPKMCFIGDSALYGKALNSLNVEWLTRVPETDGECKTLVSLSSVTWQPTSDERYQIYSYTPKEKKERWILVRSEPAFHRENQTFLRNQNRIFEKLNKALWHCSFQVFGCESDAKKQIEKLIQSKKHCFMIDYVIHKKPIFNAKGRPQKNAVPDGFNYVIEITGISSDLIKIAEKKKPLDDLYLQPMYSIKMYYQMN